MACAEADQILSFSRVQSVKLGVFNNVEFLLLLHCCCTSTVNI